MPKPIRCLLAALLLALPAPPAAAAAPPRLEFRADPFHNQFHVLDHVSNWRGGPRQADYLAWWRQRNGLTGADREVLAGYAGVRERLSDPPPAPGGEIPFLDVLPPAAVSPEETFKLAFLRAPDLAAAKRTLGKRLTAADAAALDRAFAHFKPGFDRLWRDAGYLGEARTKAGALAERAGLAAFLERLARFYGVPAAGAAPNAVEFLLAPPDHFEATVADGVMIIPFPPSEATDEAALAGVLGVVAHEFGHHYLAQVPGDARRRISEAIVEGAGILNPGRVNYLEEAVQAAAGNVVFVKTRLPAHYRPEDTVYSLEPDEPYPYAIDGLARRLAPRLEAALAGPDGFERDFLPVALAEQRALVPPAPRHFTRVAEIVGQQRPVRLFERTFPGVMRGRLEPGDALGVREARAAHPGRTLVHVLLPADVADYEAASGPLGLAAPAPGAGVLRVVPRPAGAPEIVVFGADLVGLRKALIALHQLDRLPGPDPIRCD